MEVTISSVGERYLCKRVNRNSVMAHLIPMFQTVPIQAIGVEIVYGE